MLIKKIVNWNRQISKNLTQKYPSFFGGGSYPQKINEEIHKALTTLKPKTILEIGGIDRPLLKKSEHYQYIGVDIEYQENCNKVYDTFITQSVEEALPITTDLILSFTLMEHVKDNTATVQNMYAALQANGKTIHYMPSKWHPYSIALRLVGPVLQKKLIAILRPEAVDVTGYPAYFNHCSPSSMEKLFKRSGFIDIQVTAFYRASDYFAFFVPFFILVAFYENICKALNFRGACSGFVICAKKGSS